MKRWGMIALLSLATACGTSDDDNTNNGATNNGATNNGATNNGATNNGATNNGATNNGSTNNGSTNNGAAGGGFQADATYDTTPLQFNCTTFEFSDGNAVVYTEQIDTWSIKCRSDSGTHQITVAISAPMNGEQRDTLTADGGEVSFGPIDTGNANKLMGGATAQSITIDTVEAGVSISGSFSASWAGDGTFPAANATGTFDVVR